MKLNKIILSACIGMLSLTASAQSVALNTEGMEPDYVKTIVERSTKNTSQLNLTGEKAEAVRNIVANHYFWLNRVWTTCNDKIKEAKANLTGAERDAAVAAAKAECDSRLYRDHFNFAAQLGMYLTQDEIISIMDALTYNKVKVTYDAYLDEVPSLKDYEKRQIYVWLCEARDLAIDGDTSNMKHDIFNKYKGRINNFLNKQGYDMRKEREEWQKRIAARNNKK